MNNIEFLRWCGKRVKSLREEAGMTIKEVAEKTHSYSSDISAFERHGQRIKSILRIKEIVHATNHTMADLFIAEQPTEKKTTKSPSLSKGSLTISLESLP